MDKAPECKECKYWERTTDITGECRIRAPQADVERGGRKFPETAEIERCYEFESE